MNISNKSERVKHPNTAGYRPRIIKENEWLDYFKNVIVIRKFVVIWFSAPIAEVTAVAGLSR